MFDGWDHIIDSSVANFFGPGKMDLSLAHVSELCSLVMLSNLPLPLFVYSLMDVHWALSTFFGGFINIVFSILKVYTLCFFYIDI